MSASGGGEALSAPGFLNLGNGLFLRHLTGGDAPIIYSVVDADREYLREWLPWVNGAENVSETFQFIAQAAEQRREGKALIYGMWVELEFAGIVGLHDMDAANGTAQIGYWLRRSAQGKGWMTLACVALLGLGFEILGLERVEIRCATGNRRSSAIPNRLGFTHEGVLRHAQRLNGVPVDLEVYGLLAEEYRRNLTGLAEGSGEQVESGLEFGEGV